MLKKVIFTGVFACCLASAQWATFTTQTASTNLSGFMDGKLNWQTGSGAPTSQNGTAGKDVYFDTTGHNFYVCVVTGTPCGSWFQLVNLASLATVATSGSYLDLSNRPPLSITLVTGGQNSVVTTASISATFRAVRACTITGWSLAFLSGDVGTATVKFWKIASGSSVPTVANSINTSGVSLSSGTAVSSSTLTDFTTSSVAANDLIVMSVVAVTGSVSSVTGTLTCQ